MASTFSLNLKNVYLIKIKLVPPAFPTLVENGSVFRPEAEKDFYVPYVCTHEVEKFCKSGAKDLSALIHANLLRCCHHQSKKQGKLMYS